MDYRRIYVELIENAKHQNRSRQDNVYYENHHIIPRCLRKNLDVEWNLVLLTSKEHFMAHLLLTKIYPTNRRLKTALSAMMLDTHGNRILTSKQFEKAKQIGEQAKKEYLKELKYHFNSILGKLSQETKDKICSLFFLTTQTKEQIAEQFGISAGSVLKILKEAGYTNKQIKSIACKKRENRHKKQLKEQGLKRKSYCVGTKRSSKAIEQQRQAITQYWQQVKAGTIQRKEKTYHGNRYAVICIETGEKYFSAAEVCDKLHIGRSTLLKHLKDGLDIKGKHYRRIAGD